MWKKQKKNHNNVTCIDTLIASDVIIKGDIHYSGGIQVDGTVHGNIVAVAGEEAALVRVTRNGRVCGDIEGPNLVINGRVEGNVKSYQHLELAPQATIFGNVHYNLIEMVVGAEVNGSLFHINEDEQSSASTDAVDAVKEVESLGEYGSSGDRSDKPSD